VETVYLTGFDLWTARNNRVPTRAINRKANNHSRPTFGSIGNSPVEGRSGGGGVSVLLAGSVGGLTNMLVAVGVGVTVGVSVGISEVGVGVNVGIPISLVEVGVGVGEVTNTVPVGVGVSVTGTSVSVGVGVIPNGCAAEAFLGVTSNITKTMRMANPSAVYFWRNMVLPPVDQFWVYGMNI
jgi:hypothetical protein